MTECPIVETSLGKVKGKSLGKVEGGKNVFLYSSLPFAKPPTGELRFELPVSPEPWDGILDATKHSSIPIQDKKIMEELLQYLPLIDDQNPKTCDEDCLYLSVYTSNTSNTANLPVLLWLYGGGFIMGGESYYDARVIASLHDVVVVVPNYRVSVFGFLSLGKGTGYPGNVGLHDQVMAMKWTQSHIEKFGGNRERVTIFGESAGSMSVGFHIASPLSTGLFHRAISHSGTFHNNGLPFESGDKALKAFLNQLKITEENPSTLIKILKSLPPEELLEATKAIRESYIHFVPVYDGNFFPKPIPTMRKEPVVNNVPYIVGCNSTEGHGIMNMDFVKDYNSGITKESYEHEFKSFVAESFCVGLTENGYDVITKEYEKNKENDDKMKWKKIFGETLADAIFINPTLKALKQHVESNEKTYMYVMTHQPQLNHDSTFGPESARKHDFCECDHTDDIVFTFGMPLTEEKLTFDAKFTKDEKQLSKEWMKYIVNFATNGDPTVGLLVNVKWPQYNLESREFLSVQQPCSIGRNFREEVHKFWIEVVEPMGFISK